MSEVWPALVGDELPQVGDHPLWGDLTQYLPLSGSQSMTGDLDMGGNDILVDDLYLGGAIRNSTAPGVEVTVSETAITLGNGSTGSIITYDDTADTLTLAAAPAAGTFAASPRVLVEGGTVSAPIIANVDDTDTGIYFTDDAVHVAGGGVELISFTESTTDEIDSKVQHKFSGGFYGKSVDWDGGTAPDLTLAPDRYALYDGDSDYHESDSGTNTITGDLTIIALVHPSDASGIETIANHWSSNANQRGYNFRISGQSLVYQWTTAGSGSGTTATSTADVTELGTSPVYVMVTHDVNNGASGNDVKFYKSTDGANFSQVGSTVTNSGTTSIHASTENLIIGWQEDFGRFWAGNIYGVWIYSGIDPTTRTRVAAFEPINWPVGGDGIEDRAGLTWTAAATAAIAGGDTGLYVSSDSDAIQAPVIHYAAPVRYEWRETSTAATASFADVIDHTISLPFSSGVWDIELTYRAEGTDLGEAESLEIQAVVISDGNTYTSPDSPGVGNPNGTGGAGTLGVSWSVGTLDVNGTGYIASASGGSPTTNHNSSVHNVQGSPTVGITGSPSVTIADIPYSVSDEWNLIRFPIVGNDLRVKAQIKGTSYTGTPNVRLTVKAWRVG